MKKYLLTIALAMGVHSSYAAITVPVYSTDSADPQQLGTVKLEASRCGVLITPDLHHLSAGLHGMHIHEHPSCDDKGMAAGGHLDPSKTDSHRGPYQHGHLGDLPFLYVDKNGDAALPVLAPNLKLSQIRGHSIMIHAGGDNYADVPAKLGGGGERIACGVVK